MSKTIQVELVTDGMYSGSMKNCIGKVFEATPYGTGYNIPVQQLEAAGYINDGSIIRQLHFYDDEVRVLDDG